MEYLTFEFIEFGLGTVYLYHIQFCTFNAHLTLILDMF